ncbi:hypothetical protein, partial [Sphingobacterium sp. GVS05A]|uniref:hypothetical protein n=1 Tax=Sphingobacterium sp. GVS05A TaxID=2862679 RepID=UPI001CBDE6FE
SSHSEQSSQARQSRWYCRNRWESRSVPFFTQKPLLETVKGFLRLHTFAIFLFHRDTRSGLEDKSG